MKFLDAAGLAKVISLIQERYLSKAGGTVSGDLTVSGTTTVADPVNDSDAATKKYVDDAIADALSKLNPLAVAYIGAAARVSNTVNHIEGDEES